MQEVIDIINSTYDIPALHLVNKVEEGVLSNNYILQNKEDRFFLKQYRFDERPRVEEVHKVKFFFSAGGIPIILPIKDKNGDSIVTVNGKHYSLFPYAEGRIIRRKDRSSQAFSSAGEMLARIHLLTKGGVPDFVSQTISPWSKERFFDNLALVEVALNDKKELDEFDHIAQSSIVLKKKIVEFNSIQCDELNLKNDHLVHGDYHGGNLFYDEHDSVQHVFDLEKAEASPRIFEVIRTVDFMCLPAQFGEESFSNIHTFFRAYHLIYPLSEREVINGVKYFYLKKAHSLWIEKEHYLKNNMRTDKFLQSDLDTLNYYGEHLEEYTKFLLKSLI